MVWKDREASAIAINKMPGIFGRGDLVAPASNEIDLVVLGFS